MCLAKRGFAARVTNWDLVRRVSTWTLLALSTPRATACATVKLRVINSMLRAMMRALFSDVAAARWSRSVVVRSEVCEAVMLGSIAGISCRREDLAGREVTGETQPRLDHRSHRGAGCLARRLPRPQASSPSTKRCPVPNGARHQTVRNDRRRFL